MTATPKPAEKRKAESWKTQAITAAAKAQKVDKRDHVVTANTKAKVLSI